ncbi:uncharacterized protein LOC108674050 [Hyalella azteca]|uniref:Uncharacterized protein LOC108674050 n=1 Tax=Hyalella azteca TaxID=294128 RepID=A0A8B7NUM8_HYAAZ|nr:uncharacterized protein LOC108674050 [Hyalella azteca]
MISEARISLKILRATRRPVSAYLLHPRKPLLLTSKNCMFHASHSIVLNELTREIVNKKPLCRTILPIMCKQSIMYQKYRNFSSWNPQSNAGSIKKEIRILLSEPHSTEEFEPFSGYVPFSEQKKASSLVPRYLVNIAVDPYVQHDSILEIFRLYAVSMRPLTQDKIDFPVEFKSLLPATEQAFKVMSLPELYSMSQYLQALRAQKLTFIDNLIRSLCQECCARLHHKPKFEEAMKLYELAIDVYARALPRNYHEIFSEFFVHNVERASLKEKVKLMYFYCLNPKQMFPHLFEELLEAVIPHVSDMSFQMQGVVAHCVLKSGVELHPDLPLLPMLAPNLLSCLLSSDQLSILELNSVTSELELMRLARYQNNDITFALESFLLSCREESCLTPHSIPLFLAYLATRHYNKEVFAKIEAYLMKMFASESDHGIQMTELARIMWAYSAVAHPCSDVFIKQVMAELASQVKVENMNKNLLKFVDALYSMAVMGRVDLQLCRHALLPIKGKALYYGGHLQVKLLSRIAALRECISIEYPEVVLPPKTTPPVTSVPLDPLEKKMARPLLLKVYNALEETLADSTLLTIKHHCPLETVKHSGVCLQLTDPSIGTFVSHSSVVDTQDSNVSESSNNIDPMPPFAQNSEGGGDFYSEVSDSNNNNAVCSGSEISYSESELVNRLVKSLVRWRCPVSVEVVDENCTIREGSHLLRHTGIFMYKLRLLSKLGWKCVLISGEAVANASSVAQLMEIVLQELER